MNNLKKSIAFLVALGLMPSPKAIAGDLSYGIKIGGATSFCHLSDKLKKSQIKKLEDEGCDILELTSRIWNPWFGTALYMEYSFNNYIGLGTELVYSRFDSAITAKWNDARGEVQQNNITSRHTVGLPVLLIWSWTEAIRPDFKEDYFHGRSFWGLHPFFCVRGVSKVKWESKSNGWKDDMTLGKIDPEFRFGFIGGTSFEFPNGLLLEIKSMLPYNIENEKNKDKRLFHASIHLSVGCNFAKLHD